MWIIQLRSHLPAQLLVMPAFSLAREFFHFVALAPVAVLLLARRDAPLVYWIIALAFAVSWFHDAAALVLGGTWDLVPYLMLATFGLLCWAFGGPVLAGVYVAMAVTGWAAGPVFVAVLGSMLVLAPSVDHELAWPMWLYAGIGTLCYMAMEARAADVFMPWWWGYQGARLGAFGLFARASLS